MKNILLPTDFSENSRNAIDYAIRFFENMECNFYLLHVNRIGNMAVSNASYIISKEDIENIYIKPSKLKLRELLKHISKSFPENSNHNFYCLTDHNFFIESIRKNVEEKQIDYIVMGTKGASGLEKIILGSNTADVITKVKCNTMAIPENAIYAIPKEVCFATDFSLSHDLHVLQPILNIIKQCKASLRILHIKKKDEVLNEDQLTNKDLLKDLFKNIKYTFHFLSNTKVEDAIECFVESRNIDLMCMVAKNLNYFQQILFHSKVEKISYHTNIPFLVLHKKN